MPGRAEFMADGADKMIIAELPDGDAIITLANCITGERRSITMRRTTALEAAHTLAFVAREVR
jgi:hypothetical protein